MRVFVLPLMVFAMLLGVLGDFALRAVEHDHATHEATDVVASPDAATSSVNLVANASHTDDCLGRVHPGPGGCGIDAVTASDGFGAPTELDRLTWAGSNSQLKKTLPAPEPPPPIIASLA